MVRLGDSSSNDGGGDNGDDDDKKNRTRSLREKDGKQRSAHNIKMVQNQLDVNYYALGGKKSLSPRRICICIFIYLSIYLCIHIFFLSK